MNRGEFLTRLSIWLALVAYTVAVSMQCMARGRPDRWKSARWAWTFGCVCFLIHVVCAFAYFHDWSHTAALRDTARQTAAMTGWNWGGGLYFNYIFAAAWLMDVLWWWLAPASFAQRSSRLNGIWHGFFFFMVVNGAVVFVHGPMRWFGIALCSIVVVLWYKMRFMKATV
jgi:hypothetical protein